LAGSIINPLSAVGWSEARSRAVEATPLTVEVRLVPESESRFESIIETELPTPLVRFVKVLLPAPDVAKVFELIIVTPVPEIPLTAVVKVLALELFATVLIIDCNPVLTPLTVEVNPLVPLLTRVLVVEPVSRGNKFKGVPVTPFTVVVRLDPLKVLETVVPALIADCKSWVETIPLTVEERLVPESESALVVAPASRPESD
jgi:hypothetical protein